MTGTPYDIIFWLISGLFTLGAVILAIATIVKVVRLRNVRLSWKSGKLKGYPLFSSLFLLITSGVLAVAIQQGATQQVVAAGCYILLGCCWFMASFFSAKRYITDNGIVKNINEPSQTVAWHQIRDFVEKKPHLKYTEYAFFYTQNKFDEQRNLIRLDIKVPEQKKKSFKNLVSHKLGHRIRCYVDKDIDFQQFE